MKHYTGDIPQPPLMQVKTGGQAFPCDERPNWMHPGMTLRDYFAARLMAQIMDETKDSLNFTYADAAKHAYQAADAMLKERG